MFNRMTPIMDNQPDCGYISRTFLFQRCRKLEVAIQYKPMFLEYKIICTDE